MFLQRNTAGQVFTLPGTLRVIADGSAVTTGASLTWIKDGTGAAAAGTLTHVSDGGYTYAPSQSETDCKIAGWVLSKTGAAGLAGSIRSTGADPDDAAALGLTRLDADVSSRMATFTLPSNFAALSISAGGKAAVTMAAGDGADAASVKTTLGAAGAGLTNLGDARLANLDAATSSRAPASTALSTANWTAARAGYLDNLDVGGLVASHADETVLDAAIAALGSPQQAGSAVTLPSIPAGWLTAAGIAAGALDGKGDWLTAAGYTAPDNASIATILTNVGTLLTRVGQSLLFDASGFVKGNVQSVDGVQIEPTTGTVAALNLRQAVSEILAWTVGLNSASGGVLTARSPGGTPRGTCTVDGSGNRSNVALTPPA